MKKTGNDHNRRKIKKLYRSKNNKMIAGICGGIAEYLNADPSLVRLATVLIVLFTGGMGLLVYVIAWVIIPVNPN